MFIEPESTRTLFTVLAFVVALIYVRYAATRWISGPRTAPPMRFYFATMTTLGGSSVVILWLLYVDYATIDPVIVVAWLFFVLAQCWMVWRVAKLDPLAQEALTDWSWSSRKCAQNANGAGAAFDSDAAITTTTTSAAAAAAATDPASRAAIHDSALLKALAST